LKLSSFLKSRICLLPVCSAWLNDTCRQHHRWARGSRWFPALLAQPISIES
jgi:hypothetical protein